MNARPSHVYTEAARSSNATVYLEVIVAAEEERDGRTIYETTDWSVSSGDIEVPLPRRFKANHHVGAVTATSGALTKPFNRRLLSDTE